MYKLYTDKQELFECDIQLEGASLTDSKARLVIETEDISLLFKGKINKSGKCQIPVKRLKGLLGESAEGSIKLEVIAEDTYFTPWESDFKVEASKKVQVEVKSQNKEIIKESKPSVKVKNVNEVTNEEKDHVLNILKLLIKEDISLKNVSFKKNKLNHIVATYLDKHPINESQKDQIVNGVISGLSKLK